MALLNSHPEEEFSADGLALLTVCSGDLGKTDPSTELYVVRETPIPDRYLVALMISSVRGLEGDRQSAVYKSLRSYAGISPESNDPEARLPRLNKVMTWLNRIRH